MSNRKDEAKSIRRELAAKGGRARRDAMTAEERSESARRAAETRWGKRDDGDPLAPRATHAAVVTLGGAEIECAVLDNGIRVLPTRGVTRAFGGRKTGSDEPGNGAPVLPPFLASEAIKKHISADLLARLRAPIVYRPLKGGRTAHGYEALLLPRICRVVLAARRAGDLRANQAYLAAAAEVLVDGLSEVGIIALIDEATGYQADRARDELQQILKAYVAEEMLPWLKRFPDEFFRQVYRLQGWKTDAGGAPRKHPGYVGRLINECIYRRLPSPVLPKLREMNPSDDSGRRKHKHHQFLTEDTGIPHLDHQIVAVTTLMRAANGSKVKFHELLVNAFPVPGDQFHLGLDAEA